MQSHRHIQHPGRSAAQPSSQCPDSRRWSLDARDFRPFLPTGPTPYPDRMSQNLNTVGGSSPVAAVTAFAIESASPSDDVQTLARQMADRGVGALLVQGHAGELSIVTERDIVHAVASGDHAWAVDVMTRDVIEVASTTTIADAAETMRVAGVRHLLVRRDDDAVGIASIRDLLGPLLDSIG